MFNQSSTLRAAVESALSQADEVIVVNDASTDGFAGALHGLLLDNPHLRVLHTYARAGVCYARNLGILHARNPLIFPLDADDELIPDTLVLLEAAYQPGIAVYGDWIEDDAVNKRLERVHAPPPDMLYRKIPARGFLFHRDDWEKAGQYDPAFNFGAEDWAFMLALQRAGVRFWHVDTPVIHYTITADGRAAHTRRRWPLIDAYLEDAYGSATERYQAAR